MLKFTALVIALLKYYSSCNCDFLAAADNVYASAFVSVIAECRGELRRLYYLISISYNFGCMPSISVKTFSSFCTP